MKGLRIWLIAGIASATLLLFCLSPASALQFWFTKAGETTPITELVVAPNEVFTLSVWTQHDQPVTAIGVMVGWDTADKRGPSASPQEKKVELNGTLSQAVRNYFRYENLGDPDTDDDDWGMRTNVRRLGGAGSDRPYGLEVAWTVWANNAAVFRLAAVDISDGIKLFDITLINKGVVPGSSPYPLVIYSDPTTNAWTSLVVLSQQAGGATVRPAGSTILTLVPVPEPGSLMALATGVVGLAGMALRRRRA